MSEGKGVHDTTTQFTIPCRRNVGHFLYLVRTCKRKFPEFVNLLSPLGVPTCTQLDCSIVSSDSMMMGSADLALPPLEFREKTEKKQTTKSKCVNVERFEGPLPLSLTLPRWSMCTLRSVFGRRLFTMSVCT